MAKKPMYTVESYLLYEDGTTVPFNSLTEEEKEAWRQRASERLSKAMTRYFEAHPDEYEKLCERDKY